MRGFPGDRGDLTGGDFQLSGQNRRSPNRDAGHGAVHELRRAKSGDADELERVGG